MPYASSIHSYPDIRDAFDKALASAKGVRLTFPDEKAAITFKGRANSFRYKDRKENKKIYPEGHAMHGCSPYDPLMVKTVEPTVVAILKLEAVEYNVEELE